MSANECSLEYAAKLLEQVIDGEEFISGAKAPADDQAIVISAAILAVATELRYIRNALSNLGVAANANKIAEPIVGSSKCDYCDGTGEWIPAPGHVASCPQCGGKTVTPIYHSTLRKI